MRMLVIDKSVEERVAQVKRHAERNIITAEEIAKALKTGYAAGDDPNFEVNIPGGYRVVYTQDIVKEIGNKLVHHFSFSSDKPGKFPNPTMVHWITKELFKVPAFDPARHAIWFEPNKENPHALNVIIPVDGSSCREGSPASTI